VANYFYEIEIWDTGGEGRFRSIVRNYIRNKDGVFLLFDVTNELSFNNVSHWMKALKEINDNNSKYIVYLIGNKIDKPNRVIQRETAETLAKSLGIKYFEVSCKINMNIPEVVARMIMECSVGEDYRFFNDFEGVKDYTNFNKFIRSAQRLIQK
jgi:small GTP-binding protein